MKKSKDLSRIERLEISILLKKKYSMRAIALVLGRSPNTISYEIRANSTLDIYDPLKAQTKARLRKRMRKLEWAKLNVYPRLRAFVIEKLMAHWNPDEIAGHLKKNEGQYSWYISKTAIYDWLRTIQGERYCAHLYSKRKRAKRRMPRARRALIPSRISIDNRFLGANHRTRYGHFESDTIMGKKGTSGVVKTVLERKSRLLLAHKVDGMRPIEHIAVLKEMILPLKIKSITFDNGIENQAHKHLHIPTFFCDPYASWQRGANEHGNKMLRRYFPKGTDFSMVTQTELDRAVQIINNKPRKILGYRSALEVAIRAGIMSGI